MKEIKDIEFLEPPVPNDTPRLSNATILNGPPVTDIDRIRILSDGDFEVYTLEWVYGYLKNQYHQVVLLGGSGDKG